MKKRGQVTIFIILGILFVVIFFFLSYIQTIEKPEVELPIDAAPIKSFTNSCIKSTLEQGLFDVGYANFVTLENYMNNNIKICIKGFSVFQGINITGEDISSNINLTQNNQTLITNIEYPLTIKQQGSTSKLNEFYLSYDLTSQINLQTVNGITQSQTSINSQNMAVVLNIPSGVNATIEGNYLNLINIEIKNSANYNGPVIGQLVYDLKPDGSVFNPPIKLTIEYDESDIPPGMDENDLKIGYFEDIWLSIPSVVDPIDNTVTAHIDHFSEYGITYDDVQCLSNAASGSEASANLFSLDDPIVVEKAQEALQQYANNQGKDVSEINTADEYMEAVAYYVYENMYFYCAYDGSEHEPKTASYILRQSSNLNCGGPYCGDGQEFTTLKTALLRSLGVSWKCVFSAKGQHSHTYNIILYKNAYRILDWAPLHEHFHSNTHDYYQGADHDTTTIWNDHIGNHITGSVHPSEYAYNYPNGTRCPEEGWTVYTYYSDICPGTGLTPRLYEPPSYPKGHP